MLILLGLAGIATAAVGIMQQRAVASPDFNGDPADYRLIEYACEVFDDGQQPVRPAEIASKVQNLFRTFGIVGVVMIVVGTISMGLKVRRDR